MDLSITSANAYVSGISPLGSRAERADSASSNLLPPASGHQTGAADAATESASGRPAREARESGRLPPEAQRQLNQLRQRDREVRAHEQAHRAAGGRYVTGGSYTYQTGPDGRSYAIGGEVSIDGSAGRTPEETLRKAEQIRRAALAPADPSPQDYSVASQANRMAASARAEIAAQRREEVLQQIESNRQQETSGTSEPAAPADRRSQHAIAAFTAIGGSGALHSNPDPIDELV